MPDLHNYLAGRVMAFVGGSGDDVPQPDATMVEVTDRADGEIELAFDMVRPKRRVYLKVRVSDLRAVMKESRHDD